MAYPSCPFTRLPNAQTTCYDYPHHTDTHQQLRIMKPAPFAYVAPTSLEEALDALSQNADDAKLLAGGQSLIPVMNFRLAQPTMLIDLNTVPELAYIKKNGHLRIGGMTRQSQLEHNPLVAQHAKLIAETMHLIAHPQIRNRGTIGGSLAHADPAGELPVLTVALGAEFVLTSQRGDRVVSAEDFYVALFETALEPDEILTEVRIPDLPARTGVAFHELARRHGDYAQAGVAAVVTLDENGFCADAKLVFLNVGDVPMVSTGAIQMLVAERPGEAAIAAAAEFAAQNEIEPSTDVHATAAYKRHLAGVLAKRALHQAVERAAQSI